VAALAHTAVDLVDDADSLSTDAERLGKTGSAGTLCGERFFSRNGSRKSLAASLDLPLLIVFGMARFLKKQVGSLSYRPPVRDHLNPCLFVSMAEQAAE